MIPYRDGPRLPYSFRPLDFGVPSYVELLVTFEGDEEIRNFQKAIRELCALDDTEAFLVDMADSIVDHRPGSDTNTPRPPYLMGRVVGPQRKNIPDGDQPVNMTAWAATVGEILERYGLDLEDDTNEVVS
jgi:hypothetical protein